MAGACAGAGACCALTGIVAATATASAAAAIHPYVCFMVLSLRYLKIFVGFAFARDYTLRRLRFVDTTRNPAWPWIVGLLAAVVAAPVMWLLPLVGAGTAAIFGIGTGLGTASGVKALRRGGD